jgi:hypothetical protein
MKWNSRDSEYGILAEDESWLRLSRMFGHPAVVVPLGTWYILVESASAD